MIEVRRNNGPFTRTALLSSCVVLPRTLADQRVVCPSSLQRPVVKLLNGDEAEVRKSLDGARRQIV